MGQCDSFFVCGRAVSAAGSVWFSSLEQNAKQKSGGLPSPALASRFFRPANAYFPGSPANRPAGDFSVFGGGETRRGASSLRNSRPGSLPLPALLYSVGFPLPSSPTGRGQGQPPEPRKGTFFKKFPCPSKTFKNKTIQNRTGCFLPGCSAGYVY